jgi:hypothetical protein
MDQLSIVARLSADQCRAISEHLFAYGDVARGNWFKELAERAAREDWPSSASAPFKLLTDQESASIWNGAAGARQRVFAPYLTQTELAALRRRDNEAREFMRKELWTPAKGR